MSEAVWNALAEKALNGTALDALTSTTFDGIKIAPLYPRHAVDPPHVPRRPSGAWTIAQRVDHPVADEANRLALLDLEGGADALTLVCAGETGRGFGLAPTETDLAAALKDVELDYIALRLDAGAATIEAVHALAAITTARRLTSANLVVDIGFDPIGCLARTGRAIGESWTSDDLRAFMAANGAAGLAGRTFLADGRAYHESGAGPSEELAAILATAVAYLRRLESSGLDLAAARAAIGFLVVADADTFLSIAKLRALRRLWARVEAACGLIPEPMRVHAETAWRMMTRHDPWVNAMRVTAAVFAAGVGGADAITALPFTLPLGLPEDRARRLARNTQLVLLEETHLAAVEDPAAGSGGLEALTTDLAEKAWVLFQEIEREGGIAASLQTGALQARIAVTARKRAHAVATMALGLTGTSIYPPLSEMDYALADVAPRTEPAPGALALPAMRDAEPFEVLRARAQSIETRTGSAPMVTLATIGTPAQFGPRATYAAQFLAAGGLQTETVASESLAAGDDPQALTRVVCVCAPDALLTAQLPAILTRLRTRGARHVFVAGSPRAIEADGLDGYLHQGCDALRVLGAILTCFEAPHG